MYSVVLMAALTTGSSAPDYHWRGGCHGYASGCHGCYGCYGCWGCAGGWGGWGCNCNYACWGGYSYGVWGGYNGCYGVYGCNGCYGAAPVAPAGAVAPAPPPEKAPPPKQEKKESSLPSKAKLIVELPPDAKLYVDDQVVSTAPGKRSFNTPALEPGRQYYYMVRAEVTIDGQSYAESKRVLIRAGQEARATFPELETRLALIQR